jgi:hypothetical protein
MTYHVRLLDPDADRALLLAMWAENLPVAGENLDAKLDWFYRAGPHGQGRAYAVDAAGSPIGCAGLGMRTIAERGRSLRAGLFADLAIDRRHRSGLPALVLLRAVQRHVSSELDFGYGFPNARAIAMYRRAGYQVLGEIPRYVRVLRSMPYLRQKSRWIAGPASLIVDGSFAALAALRARAARGYELAWPADFDHRFDTLWEQTRHGRIACERTSALLRWRFLGRHDLPYRIITISRAGMLRGYAVVRTHDGHVEVSDLLAIEDADYDALFALLVIELGEIGASSIGVRYLGGPRIPQLLARHRFSRRPGGRAIVITAGHPELRDLGAWHLTDLDEDV